MHYREAGESDVGAMARLRAASWGSEPYWRERIHRYLRAELHPRGALAPRVVYVACEDDGLVGLISGHLTRRFGCEGELEWVDVAERRRGTGVARELLHRLAAWFVEHGAARVCVDVEPANERARRFYARHGARDLRPHWMVWEDIRTVNAGR